VFLEWVQFRCLLSIWAKYWFAYWGTQHWTANCGEWY
jgi:hypothetical protein